MATSSRTLTKRSSIAKALEAEIGAGQWLVAASLPTEAELMRRFDVSRETIRLALADLRALGLIESRQGVGSIVVRQRPANEYSQSLQSINELMYYSQNTKRRVVRVDNVVLTKELAEAIGAGEGEQWCRALTLRTATNQSVPMGISTVWVPGASRYAIDASRKSGMPVFLEIQAATGRLISRVQQVIGARLPDKAQAKLLQCGIHDPLLQIKRWYYTSEDVLIEMSETLHPPERFQYAMTLRHVSTGVSSTSKRK